MLPFYSKMNLVKFNLSPRADREIPSGLIVAGLNVATHSEIFRSIERCIKCESGVSAITLDFSQAPNLKSALKYINRIATNQDFDLNEGETFVDRHKVCLLL